MAPLCWKLVEKFRRKKTPALKSTKDVCTFIVKTTKDKKQIHLLLPCTFSIVITKSKKTRKTILLPGIPLAHIIPKNTENQPVFWYSSSTYIYKKHKNQPASWCSACTYHWRPTAPSSASSWYHQLFCWPQHAQQTPRTFRLQPAPPPPMGHRVWERRGSGSGASWPPALTGCRQGRIPKGGKREYVVKKFANVSQ